LAKNQHLNNKIKSIEVVMQADGCTYLKNKNDYIINNNLRSIANQVLPFSILY